MLLLKIFLFVYTGSCSAKCNTDSYCQNKQLISASQYCLPTQDIHTHAHKNIISRAWAGEYVHIYIQAHLIHTYIYIFICKFLIFRQHKCCMQHTQWQMRWFELATGLFNNLATWIGPAATNWVLRPTLKLPMLQIVATCGSVRVFRNRRICDCNNLLIGCENTFEFEAF